MVSADDTDPAPDSVDRAPDPVAACLDRDKRYKNAAGTVDGIGIFLELKREYQGAIDDYEWCLQAYATNGEKNGLAGVAYETLDEKFQRIVDKYDLEIHKIS